MGNVPWRKRRQPGKMTGERYAQIPEMVLQSSAYRALPDYAKVVLVAVASRYSGRNNGNLSLTDADASSRGVNPRWRLRAGLRLLIATGLIEVTRQGRLERGGKLCSLYALTWRDTDGSEKYDQPCLATREGSYAWAKWQKPDDWDEFVRATAQRAKGTRNSVCPFRKNAVTPHSGADRAPRNGAEGPRVAPDMGGGSASFVAPPSMVSS